MYSHLSPERDPNWSLKSSGDQRLEISLAEIGGKGLFTRELDVALASKEAKSGSRGDLLLDTKHFGRGRSQESWKVANFSPK